MFFFFSSFFDKYKGKGKKETRSRKELEAWILRYKEARSKNKTAMYGAHTINLKLEK